jgi:probable phosphoglycerate mutase
LTIAVAPELLVLVRHGQSDRNVAKAGHVFFPDEESRAAFAGVPERQAALTELGWQQARALGVRLREEHERFDLVLHSGYRRTRETAEALLEAWPVDARAAMVVGEDPLLSERDAGHAVNMTTAEAREAFPWLAEYWRTTGPLFARPPGGESIADVAARVRLFLRSREAEFASRRVLLVTHNGTLRAFRSVLEGWTSDEFEQHLRGDGHANCAVLAYP